MTKNNKQPVKVGQKLYCVHLGNRYRSPSGEYLEIVKVGREYFYLQGLDKKRFRIKTLTQVSEYKANFAVYLSEQEYLDECEYVKLEEELWRYFYGRSHRGLSITELRQIYALTVGKEQQTKG